MKILEAYPSDTVADDPRGRGRDRGRLPAGEHCWRAWIWRRLAGLELGSADVAVALAIAHHAGPDGIAFPGAERLSSLARLHVRNVRRSVDRLEQLGVLETRGGWRGQPRQYRLLLSADDPRIWTGDGAERGAQASAFETVMGGADVPHSTPKGGPGSRRY